MRLRLPSLTVAFVLTSVCLIGQAKKDDLSQAQIDQIIQKFAANESAFAKAREVYTYRQTARIQVLDDGGTARERWETTSDIVFSPEGKRTERVVRAPLSTLQSITMTPEDLQDMQSVQPFVLTTSELPKYKIRYLGRQKVDEIDCYVFAVKPITMEGKQRYFLGQVWVDDRDLLIVKSYGRAFGLANRDKDNQSPKFETYREQIDGKFWFPTYTIANDTLHFKDGQDVRVRQTIRYEDYKQFGAETKIIFGDEVKDAPKPAAPPASPANKK
jgi:hypothetical protein